MKKLTQKKAVEICIEYELLLDDEIKNKYLLTKNKKNYLDACRRLTSNIS